MQTIFVQIASYRDPELPRTIEDCLNKAAFPERLRFGICWQYDEATGNDLAPLLLDPRFRIEQVPYERSNGCCWARYRTNQLYRGEDYLLQIDAHMRFAPDWDERFVRMLRRTGVELAVISTYPPSYRIKDGKAILTELDHVPVLKLKRLRRDLTTHQHAYPVSSPRNPVPTNFIAAGMLFAPGRFCQDVEYDPNVYFQGEEINLAVRAFSHGYRLFSPDENLVWHLYDHDAPKHWTDNPGRQTGQHLKAMERLRVLLLGDHRRLGKYGLGSTRSVRDYEAAAGIDFAQAEARGRLEKETVFKRTITLRTDEIPDRDDYDLWVFCLLGEDEDELFRKDITAADILNKRARSFDVNATLRAPPSHYLLWPRASGEWGTRLVYPLSELHHYEFTLALNTSEIQRRDDYQFWVFCLLDEDQNEVYRNDIVDPDVLCQRKHTIQVDAMLSAPPAFYLLWPKTPETWGFRLIYPIDEQLQGEAVLQTSRHDTDSTIFITVASYCEPELKKTLEDCLAKARCPERLRFGVCIQYDDEGPREVRRDCVDVLAKDSRFRILRYDHRSSRGRCWARNLAQSLYREERYTLQIDAASRMIEDWDIVLIDMLERMPARRPLITGFPPLYFVDSDGNETFTNIDHPERVPTTVVEAWDEQGQLHHMARWIPDNTRFPRHTRILCGRFVFTLGVWNGAVTQDPFQCSAAEEFALSLRSFTNGYSLFNPDRIVIWHRERRPPERRHSSGAPSQDLKQDDVRAFERLRTLLAGDPERKLGCFSLGHERTLEEYAEFSGLDCATRTAHVHARAGIPPNPVSIRSNHPSPPDESDTVTIYLEGVDPITLPIQGVESDVSELLLALERSIASGDTTSRSRWFQFGSRRIWLSESRLNAVKLNLPEQG